MTWWLGLLCVLLAATSTLSMGASDSGSGLCESMVSCLEDGVTTCTTANTTCPPCIYKLATGYTCWSKDNTTNSCPFTGVVYDCSSSWGTASSSSATTTASSSSTTTASSGSAAVKSESVKHSSSSSSSATNTTVTSDGSSDSDSSSKMIVIIAIAAGGLLVCLILFAIMRRKRQEKLRYQNTRYRNTSNPHQVQKRALTKREEAFGGPYQNQMDHGYNSQLDTSKGFVDDISVDGMLAAPATPVSMLGDSGHLVGSVTGNKAMPGGPKSMGGGNGFTSVNELVSQDVSIRCTSSANVFGEYMRMKQEMQYDHDDHDEYDIVSQDHGLGDTMSDIDSDAMSLRKFSLESRAIVRDSAISFTDSEYAEAMRARGESDCFSEMSYNDEKYSFSEDDTSSDLGNSRVGGKAPDREVEI